MVDCYTTFPYVDLRASAATSIPHAAATYTKVNLATTTYNDTAFYTVTASVVTLIADGIYDINVRSGFASGSASSEFGISLNGLAFADAVGLWSPGPPTVTATVDGTVTLLQYALSAAETIQIGSYQGQTAGSAALNTSADSRLLIRKVG